MVIADDLTGANAASVLLRKSNFSAYTVLNSEGLSYKFAVWKQLHNIPDRKPCGGKSVAYNRVHNVAMLLKSDDVLVYSSASIVR